MLIYHRLVKKERKKDTHQRQIYNKSTNNADDFNLLNLHFKFKYFRHRLHARRSYHIAAYLLRAHPVKSRLTTGARYFHFMDDDVIHLVCNDVTRRRAPRSGRRSVDAETHEPRDVLEE